MLIWGITLPLVHLELPLEVIVLGALTGTAYALFGMGLTLTYQSSRVINFAQGSMGAVPHLLVASLVIDHGFGYWPALGLALTVAVASGCALELVVIRRLRHASRLVVLVATLGAAQLFTIPIMYMINLSHTKLGTSGYPVPVHSSVTVGSLELDGGRLMILVVAPLVLVALTLFLRRTSVGMASRAAAENDEAAELSGIPTARISLVVWAIAGLLAGVAAILLGPTQPIIAVAIGGGSNAFTTSGNVLLRGLGASMMGGLRSLPQVFAAGVGIGIVEAIVTWNYPSSGGLPTLVVMVIIVGSLLVRRDLRQRVRGGEESSWSLAGSVRQLPTRIRTDPRVRGAKVAMLALIVIAALVLPLPAQPSQRLLYTAILIYVMINLSLIVLTGWGGQVSLGHFAFVALGALVGGRMGQLGYPMFGALVIATAAGAAIAVVVGLPALRLRGLFLAVTTLAFAVVVDSWGLRQDWLVHKSGTSSSMRIARPHLFGINFQDELRYYYLVLALTVVAVTIVWRLRQTGVARSLSAVRDNEPMAAALAVSPSSYKLLAFVLSGAMASFAGYFYGALLVNFDLAGLTAPTFSLTMVTMVILGGPTTITGAVLGALYVRGLPYFFHSDTAVLLSSGIGLLIVLLFIPGGLASLAFRARDWVVGRLVPDAREAIDAAPGDAVVQPPKLEPRLREAPSAAAAHPIDARDIHVRYGGLAALDGVSIHAARGEIVGLIGPNGAGKTTLFDVLSGLATPRAGQVLLHGADVTSMPPEERARRGLARSFQQSKLFEELTVLDAFKIALEREEPTELVPSMLGLPPSLAAARAKTITAWELVDLLGLGEFAEKRAIELSTGTRRIAELGCVVALGADVVLLDEPTGGVAQREVEAFTPVLRQIRDHLDATMIVVAHDIPMIVGLCDRVCVLASGLLIADGPPSVLQDDPAVIAAYLGTDEREVADIAQETAVADTAVRHPVGAGT